MKLNVDIYLGDWHTTVVVADEPDMGDPTTVVLDTLTAQWASDAEKYPADPDPAVLSMGLLVTDRAEAPLITRGTHVRVMLTYPGWAHDGPYEPVLDFNGRISDVDASPVKYKLPGGLVVRALSYKLTCVEYVADLSEDKVGNYDYPEEDRFARLKRVANESRYGIWAPSANTDGQYLEGFLMEFWPLPIMPERPAAPTSTHAMVEELLDGWQPGTLMRGLAVHPYMNMYGLTSSPPLGTWIRPILSQHVNSPDDIHYPIQFVLGGGPDTPWAFPYELSAEGGLHIVPRQGGTPDTSQVAWVPASAVSLDGTTWRQSKATNPNVFRWETGDYYLVDSYEDRVALDGPVEVTVKPAGRAESGIEAMLNILGLIGQWYGNHYDAVPRPQLDKLTIHPEAIADPDAWPRLFRFRQHPIDGQHTADLHVGRLVILHDIPDEWNLHDRPVYYGRLTAASLTLAKGQLTMTADLLHKLPVDLGSNPLTIEQENKAVTWEADVLDGQTWADVSPALTWADLAVTRQTD